MRTKSLSFPLCLVLSLAAAASPNVAAAMGTKGNAAH
jgi:hypothetical protein